MGLTGAALFVEERFCEPEPYMHLPKYSIFFLEVIIVQLCNVFSSMFILLLVLIHNPTPLHELQPVTDSHSEN